MTTKMAETTAQTNYPFKKFGSVDELCSLVADGTKDWDSRWFRGTKSPAYELLPKLFRDKQLAKREGYIAVEFRRRARSQLPEITSPFDWLCAMQHFGFPTRLLDWTDSLAVALYFSIRPVGLDLDAPTIWVLDPFRLYQLTDSRNKVIPISISTHVVGNADIAFEDEPPDPGVRTKYAVPVAPDHLFRRLANQSGNFTLHGTDTRPIEKMIPKENQDILLKFVADKDRLSAIFESLDLLIPSSDSIFPDIDGIKDYIV